MRVIMATVFITVVALAQDTQSAPSLAERIDRARKVLLAQPSNEEAARQLAALRRLERAERAEALSALADGLSAYLERDLIVAGDLLRKAAASCEVKELADGFLLRSLDEMIAECPERKIDAKADDETVCSFCGDTGLADCAKCKGAGKTRCPKCKGRGELRVSGARGVTVSCDECRGSGVVTCERCLGSGTMPCRACTKRVEAVQPTQLGPNAIEAARKVICMARYLKAGGVDLYSAGALLPSRNALKP
jgi:hypothetical protein